MNTARPSAVAGRFYPADASELSASVDQLLDATPYRFPRQPKALIVPHAGYIYSGSTAATAYAALAAWRKTIRRVVLLGPTHRVAVNGLALPESTAFSTPLGDIPLDLAAMAELSQLPQIVSSDAAHAQEHSLEVHLPFLQRLLRQFTLIPLAVGETSPQAVAEVLDHVWGGPETLIVVSSDLSHFLEYEAAQQVDRDTCERILRLEPSIHPEQACGAYPVNGLLLAAQQRKLRPSLIHCCNSGDTAGSRQRVVGYAAFAFTENDQATDDLGQTLLKLARNSISAQLGAATVATVDLPALHELAASFVTLTQDGELRGCIGSLLAHRTLIDDVRHNALGAALRDPRFKPLSAEELPRTRVEVSLLSMPEPLLFTDQADALARLRPNIDGIILSAGPRRATFLPQVWEQLPEPADFIARLKQKAGLPADYWGADLRLERYSVQKWKEAAP